MFLLIHMTVHTILLNTWLIVSVLFQASLDEPTQTVIMHRTEPSRLQSLALQLSEKVGTLVENNERILEIKQGNYGGKLSKYMDVGKGKDWQEFCDDPILKVTPALCNAKF